MLRAVNIQWDVDDEEDLKHLPTQIDIPAKIEAESDDEDEYEEAISDYISDITGFCHYGFEIEREFTVKNNSTGRSYPVMADKNATFDTIWQSQKSLFTSGNSITIEDGYGNSQTFLKE